MRNRALAVLLAVWISIPSSVYADTCNFPPQPTFQATPLTDFQPGELYLGRFPGLLYATSNNPPADHDSDGQVFAGRIHLINGKVIFLSIGFSNNTIEFCGGDSFYGNDPPGQQDDPAATVCNQNQALPLTHLICSGAGCPYNQPQSFMGQAFRDTSGLVRQNGSIVLVDGAKGGKTLKDWDPTSFGCNCTTEYDRVRDLILTPSGFTESQVQSIWMKNANPDPTVSLNPNNPNDPNADANNAERHMGNIMRYVHTRYPNAQQVFLSPRIYGGYANLSGNPLNPEPYAYEIGFSIKALINSQIQEQRGNSGDMFAGNLTYNLTNPSLTVAPWIAWGPYLWASGTTARSDGLKWLKTDFRYPWPQPDGSFIPNECTHPANNGEQKVGTMLLNFMKQSAYTAWFRP